MTSYVITAATLLCLAQGAAQKPPAAKPAAPKGTAATAVAPTDVAVTLTYKGKGVVDENHKLIAWIFADANITANSRPLDTKSTAKNGDTVTFKTVPTTPFYVFSVFDEKGGYDGLTSAPPPGLPAAIYKKVASAPPTPVKAGEQIKLTLTDAQRWK